MGWSPPGSSVPGILQARILEWVATPSSRGSSWSRDWTRVSYVSWTGRQVLYHWCHLGSLASLQNRLLHSFSTNLYLWGFPPPPLGSFGCELINQWASFSLSSVWQEMKKFKTIKFWQGSEQLGGFVHCWVVNIEIAFLSAHLATSVKSEDVNVFCLECCGRLWIGGGRGRNRPFIHRLSH